MLTELNAWQDPHSLCKDEFSHVLHSYTLASQGPEACIEQLQQLADILHKCAIDMNMNDHEYGYPFLDQALGVHMHAHASLFTLVL